jgi:HK97 family phage major capsid protein
MGTGNITANTAPTMPGTTVEMGLAATPRNQPFILEFVDTGSVSTPNVMWFNKVGRENGTAFIAEGALKPLSDFDIVGETATVKKVATRFNVNEEMLTDIPFIESEIRNEGIENLRIAIDEQILEGDGLGNNLKGILEYAGGYVLPALDDSTLNANVYDAILAAHTMLNTLNFMPSAVFVHPVTRYAMRTTKDTTGDYVIPPSADTNAMNVDGLPVIAKNQIEPGYFLMGDMRKSHVRFLADINVRVGYNGEDFAYNRLTFLVEARLTHYIKDVETGAFVYDSFAVVQAALEAPGI